MRRRLIACCDVCRFTLWDRSACLRRERQSEVNGKSPFGVVTNHAILEELTPLDPPGLMGAKCQLSGPIVGKNQMSQIEENVIFNRNKEKKMLSFYSKEIDWGKKERYSHYSHKSARRKVLLIWSNILKAGYLAMLLLKLGFLILFLSMAAPFGACKTKCLARRGVL